MLSILAAPLALLIAPSLPHSRQARVSSGRGSVVLSDICTEENVRAALSAFKQEARSMFGCHEEAARIGISGDIQLESIDGPFAMVDLSGRFWHQRRTVLTNAEAYVRHRIPEVVEVSVADEQDLLDVVYDEETGSLIEDRRCESAFGHRTV